VTTASPAPAVTVAAADANATSSELVDESAGVAVMVADLLARVEGQVAERVGDVALARYLSSDAILPTHSTPAPPTLSMLALTAMHELLMEPSPQSPPTSHEAAPAAVVTPALPALPVSPDSVVRPARPTVRSAPPTTLAFGVPDVASGTDEKPRSVVPAAVHEIDGDWM